jgi:hypothetical protein
LPASRRIESPMVEEWQKNKMHKHSSAQLPAVHALGSGLPYAHMRSGDGEWGWSNELKRRTRHVPRSNPGSPVKGSPPRYIVQPPSRICSTVHAFPSLWHPARASDRPRRAPPAPNSQGRASWLCFTPSLT